MNTKERYRDLDEVRAPKDLPNVGVRAGDRGVVVAELYNQAADPSRAVEVEYPGKNGVPKAFVIYTPDLSKLISARREF